MKMIASVFTREKLGQEAMGAEVLNGLLQNGFVPNKVGSYEPLKQSYTEKKFMDLWMEKRPGCEEEEVGPTGTAGGFMAKCKKPNLMMSSSWWDCPNKESINIINFLFTKETFNNNQEQVEKLFRHTIHSTNSFYGNISEMTPSLRQGSGIMLNKKLPGVYWCNYFSEQIIERAGKEKIKAFNWWHSENDVKNGCYFYLTESPFGNWTRENTVEMKAKWQLGIKSFEEEYELENYLSDQD